MSLHFLSCLAAFAALADTVAADEVVGRVIDTAGNGLHGAYVYDLHSNGKFVTDSAGNFRYRPGSGSTELMASTAGFAAKVVSIVGAQEAIEIILQKLDPMQARTLPVCRKRGDVGLPQVSVRPDRRVRSVGFGDVDFHGLRFTLRQGNVQSEYMVVENGPLLGGDPNWPPLPSDDSVADIETHPVLCDGVLFRDIRVRTKRGREARFLGYSFSFVHYPWIHGDATRVFDEIIDSACCEASSLRGK